MPFWYPFGPPLRPQTLWIQRVLSDLSAMHDDGAIDEDYLRRAWLTLSLVAAGQDRIEEEALRREIIRWHVHFSGLNAREGEQFAAPEDVFGDVRGDGVDVLPASGPTEDPGALQLLPRCSIAGRRWEFHLTDKDSNRPAPHGHDVSDHSIVLDPYTGVVLDKNGKPLRAAKPKELRELWEDRAFRSFAARARQTMQAQQPWRPDALPPVPQS